MVPNVPEELVLGWAKTSNSLLSQSRIQGNNNEGKQTLTFVAVYIVNVKYCIQPNVQLLGMVASRDARWGLRVKQLE